jgi:hypothetical protein
VIDCLSFVENGHHPALAGEPLNRFRFRMFTAKDPDTQVQVLRMYVYMHSLAIEEASLLTSGGMSLTQLEMVTDNERSLVSVFVITDID